MAIAVGPPSSSRSAELLGERPEALGSGAVGDNAQGGTGDAEQGGAALEQLLGLVLGECLAVVVGLLGVAHVRERHLAAGAREHATERDGVVLVCSAIVGNDDLHGHGCSSEFA
jgi:hypothetical protein